MSAPTQVAAPAPAAPALGCAAGCTPDTAVRGCPEHWAIPTAAPTRRRFQLDVNDRPLAGTVWEALDVEARDYDPREES